MYIRKAISIFIVTIVEESIIYIDINNKRRLSLTKYIKIRL